MDQMKGRYKTFFETTSMHGFLEMYHAKSTFWLLFWFFVVAGSFAVTGYQVYEAIDQYINQSTLTKIQPAYQSEMIYPPIRFCLPHWLYWIDWDKVDELQPFSKESILYGLSFLTDIYSSQYFDIETAKREFLTLMKEKNFTSFNQFYVRIAKNVDKVLSLDSFLDFGLYRTPELFTEIKVEPVASREEFYEVNLFCYIAPSENVAEFFRRYKEICYKKNGQNETKNILLLEATRGRRLIDFERVSTVEYANYMANWIKLLSGDYDLDEEFYFDDDNKLRYNITKDYSYVTIPSELFINSFTYENSISLLDDVDRYFVNVKASAHVYRNSSESQCVEDERFIVKNETCQNVCYKESMWLYQQEMREFFHEKYGDIYKFKLLSTQMEENLIQDQLENAVHVNDIHFLDNAKRKNDSAEPQQVNETKTEEIEEFKWRRGIVKRDRRMECYKKCLPGCEKWTFDYSVSTSSLKTILKGVGRRKYWTNVKIEYPADGETLIMIDTDLQSWENFVGNVGGLLGIWTGASILSMIQLVYLCCFAQVQFDKTCGIDQKPRKKQNVEAELINEMESNQ